MSNAEIVTFNRRIAAAMVHMSEDMVRGLIDEEAEMPEASALRLASGKGRTAGQHLTMLVRIDVGLEADLPMSDVSRSHPSVYSLNGTVRLVSGADISDKTAAELEEFMSKHKPSHEAPECDSPSILSVVEIHEVEGREVDGLPHYYCKEHNPQPVIIEDLDRDLDHPSRAHSFKVLGPMARSSIRDDAKVETAALEKMREGMSE